MPSLSKSCRPVHVPGTVCPYVPLFALLYVFDVTANERDKTSFGTPGLSSGNVAMSSAPEPLMPYRSCSRLSERRTEFAGTLTSASIPLPPSVGRNVTLTFNAYCVCGLKMLNCVIQRVLNAPGTLAVTGMTYVSLPCAAENERMKLKRNEKTMYRRTFTIEPSRVPARFGTAVARRAFPVWERGRLARWTGGVSPPDLGPRAGRPRTSGRDARGPGGYRPVIST